MQSAEAENERNPFYSFLSKQGTSDCRSSSKEKPLPTSRPMKAKRKIISFAKV
jgi:hypothetical protein